jgi:hypothetical protein
LRFMSGWCRDRWRNCVTDSSGRKSASTKSPVLLAGMASCSARIGGRLSGDARSSRVADLLPLLALRLDRSDASVQADADLCGEEHPLLPEDKEPTEQHDKHGKLPEAV